MIKLTLINRIKNNSLLRSLMVDEKGNIRPVQEWAGDIEGYLDEAVSELLAWPEIQGKYLQEETSFTTDGSDEYSLVGAGSANDVGEVTSVVVGSDAQPLGISRSVSESRQMEYDGDYDSTDYDRWAEIFGVDTQGRPTMRLQPSSSTGETVTYTYYRDIDNVDWLYGLLPEAFGPFLRTRAMSFMTGHQAYEGQAQQQVRRLKRVLRKSAYTMSPIPMNPRIVAANVRTSQMQSSNWGVLYEDNSNN